MSMKPKDEPSTAPPPDRWYPLTLGSSFKDQQRPSSRFCTLRYEFKPASIDKSQPGTLHKNKENRVTVEFHNNQPGKSNVSFEGSSEDYKENDAVLFFDGQTFRLERLHRSVKRLRHVRQPGESAMGGLGAAAADATSPPMGKASKAQNLGRTSISAPVPVEIERIDVGNSSNLDVSRPDPEKVMDAPFSQPIQPFTSPGSKNDDLDEQLDIFDDHDDDDNVGGFGMAGTENAPPQSELLNTGAGADRNLLNQMDIDDDLADVDVNDDDLDVGTNAAEVLRAQVDAERRSDGQEPSSSSSSSSESDNSGSSSDSGSSSSDNSDSSDGDTVDSI